MAEQMFLFKNHIPPLSELMRPKNLDEVLGQEHLVGQDKLFRRSVQEGTFGSCIFWGPPGCGKTTLANVIANKTDKTFVKFNAALNGIKDVKNIILESKQRINNGGSNTILFIDEIHRFNKFQQDAFLYPLESGTILLIGATTENPSFEVNSALLSRCSIHILNKLEDKHISILIERVINHPSVKEYKLVLEDEAKEFLINYANGDARVAINALDIANQSTPSDNKVVSLKILKQVLSLRRVGFDKGGEDFYNLISALHKSIRGSDPNASLYWLARMIEGGADPLYIARRLVRFASEDIGLADPQALVQAIAAKDAVHFLGFPEGDTALAQAVVYLATAPKSNKVYLAIKKAKRDVLDKPNDPVPLHIRNAPTKLMKDVGYGKGYKYDHEYDKNFSGQTFLPDSLGDPVYYEPGEYGFERDIKKRLEYWRKLKEHK